MHFFHKTYLISFDGEDTFFWQNRELAKSYFLQTDPSLDRQYRVALFPNKKRKAQLQDLATVARINFPYLHETPDLRVDKTRSNRVTADAMIKTILHSAEPFSRIYICAHGNRDSRCLYQNIAKPKSHIYTARTVHESSISFTEIADMLCNTLPAHARNNLQIKLLACEPINFANQLMQELHTRGFIRTSVVAYTEELIVAESNKRDKNTFTLASMCVSSEQGMAYYGLKSPADTKLIFHNYNGEVECLPSRSFKQKHLNDLYTLTKHDLPAITPTQQEALQLRNTLLNYLGHYLANQKLRDRLLYRGPGLYERHSQFGYKRASCLVHHLQNVSTREILEQPTESLIVQILQQLQQFAAQTHAYADFSGMHKLRVNDASAMSHVLYGIQRFFNDRADQLLSKSLIKLKSIALEPSSKANRQRMLDLLKDQHFTDTYVTASSSEMNHI